MENYKIVNNGVSYKVEDLNDEQVRLILEEIAHMQRVDSVEAALYAADGAASDREYINKFLEAYGEDLLMSIYNIDCYNCCYTYRELEKIYDSQYRNCCPNIDFAHYISEYFGFELPEPTEEKPYIDMETAENYVGDKKIKVEPFDGCEWNKKFERITLKLV